MDDPVHCQRVVVFDAKTIQEALAKWTISQLGPRWLLILTTVNLELDQLLGKWVANQYNNVGQCKR